MSWIGQVNNCILPILLLVMSQVPLAQSLTDHGRNIADYDKAGPYIFAASLTTEEREAMTAAVHDWIWSHWQQRKLGFLLETSFNKEGEPSKFTDYVEPDTSGVWQVFTQIESEFADRSSPGKKVKQLSEWHAYTVERIYPRSSTHDPVKKVAPTARLSGREYVLVFRDKAGVVITEF